MAGADRNVSHRAHLARGEEWGPVTVTCKCGHFSEVRESAFQAGLAYESHLTGRVELPPGESRPYESTTTMARGSQPLGGYLAVAPSA